MSAQVFGLDIGRSFIKVVQLKDAGGKKILSAVGKVETPAGGIMSESPIDLKKVSDSVKACVQAAKIDTQRCAISLIESQVVTRLIKLPNLTDKELSAAINWEAEQYIPLPIKDVNLQYQIISRPEGQTAGQMEVLLVAAPKRFINKYVTVAKGAGLTVDSLETESSAIIRALTKKDEGTTVTVSMGAASTELIISRFSNVLFTRSVATGGVNLTKAIMSEFNLPASQAEQYKQTYGILEDKLGGKVAAVLKPILDILISEILKATEFTHSQIKDSNLSRLIICGGGAFLPGLSQFLTERTSLEVSLGDAWENLAKEGLILKMPGQGSFYCVATGLALRS